jgi:glycosyltransferase involved in cell wall biosynthesis
MSTDNQPVTPASSDAVRVLHFSSTYRNVGCGVGKYQEEYLAGMSDNGSVFNAFFEVSPYETREMSPAELAPVLQRLKAELREYDVLHIQHEFGLYWHFEFAEIVQAAKQAGKKVVVTVHLSPGAVKELAAPRMRGLGPRSLALYLRTIRHHKVKVRQHLVPMQQADMLIVHNQVTADWLQAAGIPESRITKLPHPVYPITEVQPATEEVNGWLNRQEGDVVLCMIGFLHRYKGTLAAVRALKFLPSNYKLLLAGSVKGDSDEMSFEDKVTNLVDELGLHDRVYITGFIADDNRLNAIIRATDVCIYPYDRVYYANASSGALNLALANDMAVVAYPTESIKEAAREVDGAIILTETFAYYELAREVQRIDYDKQRALAAAYADKLAWPKMSQRLVAVYHELIR